MSVTWIVTGAQGFIGRYASARILSSDPHARVVGVGRSPELHGCFSHFITSRNGPIRAPLPFDLRDHLANRFTYIQSDVCDEQAMRALFKLTNPIHILHLASGLRGDHSRDLLHTNTHGTASVINAALAHPRIPTVLVASSGGVYGELRADEPAPDETHSCNPENEYTAAKLAAEKTAQGLAQPAGMRLLIGRIYNVIGAGQDERHIGGRLALQLTKMTQEGNRTLRTGRVDPVRDFVDVNDVATSIVELSRIPTARGVFNIASGREIPVRVLCDTFSEVSGTKFTIVTANLNPGVLRNCANIQNLLQHGLEPKIPLRESVANCLAYYRSVWS